MVKKAKLDFEDKPKSNSAIWIITGSVIIGLFCIFIIGTFLLIGLIAETGSREPGNVAVINIEGAIMTSGGGSLLGGSVMTSQDYVDLIEEASEDDSIVAIVFMINSPGGSPVATDEIAAAIENTEKTTVAVIREVGASGAYWVASSCDHIIANRMSLVGSIGVTGSHLGFEGLLEEYNVSYRRIVSGEFKDIGTPFREMTESEYDEMQERIDVLHEIFVQEVTKNRDLPKSSVEDLASGLYWTGTESLDLGLVDELGGMNEALVHIEMMLDLKAEATEFQKTVGLAEIFSAGLSEQFYSIGKGIGAALLPSNNPYIMT